MTFMPNLRDKLLIVVLTDYSNYVSLQLLQIYPGLLGSLSY